MLFFSFAINSFVFIKKKKCMSNTFTLIFVQNEFPVHALKEIIYIKTKNKMSLKVLSTKISKAALRPM